MSMIHAVSTVVCLHGTAWRQQFDAWAQMSSCGQTKTVGSMQLVIENALAIPLGLLISTCKNNTAANVTSVCRGRLHQNSCTESERLLETFLNTPKCLVCVHDCIGNIKLGWTMQLRGSKSGDVQTCSRKKTKAAIDTAIGALLWSE